MRPLTMLICELTEGPLTSQSAKPPSGGGGGLRSPRTVMVAWAASPSCKMRGWISNSAETEAAASHAHSSVAASNKPVQSLENVFTRFRGSMIAASPIFFDWFWLADVQAHFIAVGLFFLPHGIQQHSCFFRRHLIGFLLALRRILFLLLLFWF